MTLDEVIQEIVEAGTYDPAEIVKLIEKRFDQHWLSAELLSLTYWVVTTRVRERYSAARNRGADLAEAEGRVTAKKIAGADLVWVPGGGYKPEPDCTADDLTAAAGWLRKMATTMSDRADYLERLAFAVKTAGVGTVGELEDQPARAVTAATPRSRPPARATGRSHAIQHTPARAIPDSAPVAHAPARAKSKAGAK